MRRMVKAEWTKLRTARSTSWTTIAIGPTIIAIALFVALTESLGPEDTVLGGSLTGTTLGILIATALGALTMSGEYGTGMIHVTFTACPRRATVLVAKMLVTMTAVAVVALPSSIASLAIGDALLPSGTYAPGDAWPAALGGIALTFALAAAIGLSVGTIVRHPAVSVLAATAVVLVPTMIGPLLGPARTWIVGLSPITVQQKLAQSSDAASDITGSLGGWPSLGLLAVATIPLVLAAAWLLERRDA